MSKPLFLVFFVLVCVAVSAEAAAVQEQRDCGEDFRSKLRELMDIKRSCPSAFYESCCQMKQHESSAGTKVYKLKPVRDHGGPFSHGYSEALCDMEIDGGGWLVIQRRLPNGTVNFTRNWADYENGFGDLNGEFWYGLRNIHALTTENEVELRIDMVRESDDFEFHWTYQTFRVAGASDEYRLTVGGAEGSYESDRMSYHNYRFSTYDNDNDQSSSNNCAFFLQGGWWYRNCFYANLNGPHMRPDTPGVSTSATLRWGFTDLSSAEMKIRVKQCHLAEGTSC